VLYLGAGIGFNYWEYEEVGDFLVFDDPDNPSGPFINRFIESGLAFEAHALAGVELPVHPGFSFLVEGRYSWSEDTPGGDFEGLGDLDLGGVSAYLGIAFRF
jgi:hypothetical protein